MHGTVDEAISHLNGADEWLDTVRDMQHAAELLELTSDVGPQENQRELTLARAVERFAASTHIRCDEVQRGNRGVEFGLRGLVCSRRRCCSDGPRCQLLRERRSRADNRHPGMQDGLCLDLEPGDVQQRPAALDVGDQPPFARQPKLRQAMLGRERLEDPREADKLNVSGGLHVADSTCCGNRTR